MVHHGDNIGINPQFICQFTEHLCSIYIVNVWRGSTNFFNDSIAKWLINVYIIWWNKECIREQWYDVNNLCAFKSTYSLVSDTSQLPLVAILTYKQSMLPLACPANLARQPSCIFPPELECWLDLMWQMTRLYLHTHVRQIPVDMTFKLIVVLIQQVIYQSDKCH